MFDFQRKILPNMNLLDNFLNKLHEQKTFHANLEFKKTKRKKKKKKERRERFIEYFYQ